jgi:hypothetical protein
MAKQGVNLTVLDQQLGQSAPGQGQTEVVIGTCSGGTVPNFTPYTTTNPATIQANSGVGSAPRLAAYTAQLSGNPVTVCTVPNNANGTLATAGAGVMYTGTANTGACVITVTGNPNDDYYLVVTPVVAGTIGTTGIQVGISIDGGATNAYVVNMGTATTVTTGSAFTTYTGLSLSFTSATMNLGDTWYAVATAPTYSDAAVQSALQAVASIKFQSFQDVMVAGVTAASDVTAFDGYMTTLANTNRRFSRLLCGVRDAVWGGASTETEAAWITSISTAFSTTSSLRVGVCAGHYRVIDPFTQSQMRSSLLYCASGRDAAVLPSTDLGEVDLGALPNVVLPSAPDSFAKGKFFYHDEDQNPGLDAARFMSSWQLVGFPGIYIMNSNLMAPPGSDFNWLQHGHVIDEASYIVYQFFTLNLSRPVRVSAKTGFILPQDRGRLQSGCQALLNNGLGNQTSAIIVSVSQTDNILSTATLTVNIYVVPFGYLKSINSNLSLLNPANTQTFAALAAAA